MVCLVIKRSMDQSIYDTCLVNGGSTGSFLVQLCVVVCISSFLSSFCVLVFISSSLSSYVSMREEGMLAGFPRLRRESFQEVRLCR